MNEAISKPGTEPPRNLFCVLSLGITVPFYLYHLITTFRIEFSLEGQACPSIYHSRVYLEQRLTRGGYKECRSSSNGGGEGRGG